MDLFRKDPTWWTYADHQLDREAAQSYAQRFWEAANQVVVLTFGAAFGFYIIVGQSIDLRNNAVDHRLLLTGLALCGNAALGFLVWRMACHEYRLTRCYSDHPGLIDAVWSAFDMRVGLLVANLIIYFIVLWGVLKTIPASSLFVS